MLNVSTEYMALIYDDNTIIDADVVYSAFDVSAKSSATAVSNGKQSFSHEDETLDEDDSSPYRYSSLEHGNWRLNGKVKIFPANTSGIQWGWWSEAISHMDGTFENNPIITYMWSENHTSIGITLKFADPIKELKVTWYNEAEEEISTSTYINADMEETNCIITNGVVNYRKVIVEIIRVLPKHYAKLIEVDFGIEFIWDDNIITLEVDEKIDPKGAQIQSNQSKILVNNLDIRFNKYSPNSETRFIQEKQKLTIRTKVLIEGVYEKLPLGTFYLTSWESPTSYTTQFIANDLILKLEGIYNRSKFYTNATAQTILEELFNDCNLYDEEGIPQFVIADDVKPITLTGYIPPVDYRTALQQIAFALGAVVKVDRNGKVYIFRINTSDTSVETIDDSMKNDSEDKEGTRYGGVSISQYSYKSGASQTLFEGVITGNQNILFSAHPATSIAVIGTHSSYTVYANSIDIVGASGTIKVTGTPYEIYENKVIKKLPDVTVGITKQIKDVSGIYLIGKDTTADYVSDWLLSELQKSITNEFQWLGNPAIETGDYVDLTVADGVVKKALVQHNKFTFRGSLGEVSEVCL